MTDDQQKACDSLCCVLFEAHRQRDGEPTTKKFRKLVASFLRNHLDIKLDDDDQVKRITGDK